jgi:kynurenine aminotransferase
MRCSHNPVGKVFSRKELEAVGALCVKHNIIILSDEVYDRLYYVPFTRIATLSPEIAALTLTVGSAGKNFYATGWRVGYLIGPEHLIKYVAAAHTRICYSSVAPLQEAAAIGFEKADEEGFWEQSRTEMKGKVDKFCEVFDELGIPVSGHLCCGERKPMPQFVLESNIKNSTLTLKVVTSSSPIWLPCASRKTTHSRPM